MSHMASKDKMGLSISFYLKFLGVYWSFHPFHSIRDICQYLLGDCHVPGIKASVVKSKGKETDLVPALMRLIVHKRSQQCFQSLGSAYPDNYGKNGMNLLQVPNFH